MEGTLLPGEALEEDLCVRVDPQIAPRLSIWVAGGDGRVSSRGRISEGAGSAALDGLHRCRSW